MSTHYILDDDHNIVPADLMTWAAWLDDRDKKIVKQEDVDGFRVSTVFLGDGPCALETSDVAQARKQKHDAEIKKPPK